MRGLCFFLLLGLTCDRSRAQYAISPGGAGGVVHWYVASPGAAKPSFKTNRSLTDTFYNQINASDNNAVFNYNPSLLFDGANQVSIPLGGEDIRSMTYFTVYLPNDTVSENHIWNIGNNQKAGLVLTTNRMADLSSFKYMNYTDLMPSFPKINTYAQKKIGDSVKPSNQYWLVGQLPVSPRLPVKSFKGLIPEIIAFGRVLSDRERLQVSSYLAIKYGITITGPAAQYFNSSGATIWDGERYPAYHHNVAGIGRDDSSGLKQQISTSGNCPGLLVISAEDTLLNNDFLIWGDNNKPLTPADKIAGVPDLLQRQWLMVANGRLLPFSTDVEVGTKQIDAALPAKPVYWLAIDRSGSGDFSLPGTEFVKMSSLDGSGNAYFKAVAWNKNGRGKEIFSIIPGQGLLLCSTIAPPSCSSPASGTLHLKIWGGRAPYALSISKDNLPYLKEDITNSNAADSATGLTAGKYLLTIVDANKQVYSDSFFVNDSDAPRPLAVLGHYVLGQDSTLKINAGSQMPAGVSYLWQGPYNFESLSADVTISKTGIYNLSCSKDGCVFRQDVIVSSPPADILRNLLVYPNPSSGTFTVKIELGAIAPVSVSAFDEAGRLVSSRGGGGFANYEFAETLANAGIYFLVVRYGSHTATKKIIIGK